MKSRSSRHDDSRGVQVEKPRHVGPSRQPDAHRYYKHVVRLGRFCLLGQLGPPIPINKHARAPTHTRPAAGAARLFAPEKMTMVARWLVALAAAMCVAEARSTEYRLFCCTTSCQKPYQPITSWDECSKANKALGKQFVGHLSFAGAYPGGCGARGKYVYYNYESGRANSGYSIICKGRLPPPSTPLPPPGPSHWTLPFHHPPLHRASTHAAAACVCARACSRAALHCVSAPAAL